MYAVIRTGGKQYRVEQGQTLEVERVPGDELELRPLMVVDGDSVRAKPSDLEGSTVKARVVGDTRGEKITGFTYKNKSNQRRRWGHRQDLSIIEITSIDVPRGTAAKTPAKKAPAKKPAAKKAPAKKPAAKKPAAKKTAAKKPAAKKTAAKKTAAKKTAAKKTAPKKLRRRRLPPKKRPMGRTADVEEEGCSVLTEWSRLHRTATGREGVQRFEGAGRGDPGAPTRYAISSRRERRQG